MMINPSQHGFLKASSTMVYERKQVSKGDDPRTIWGSSDESLDDNSVCVYHLFVRNIVGTIEYRSINKN